MSLLGWWLNVGFPAVAVVLGQFFLWRRVQALQRYREAAVATEVDVARLNTGEAQNVRAFDAISRRLDRCEQEVRAWQREAATLREENSRQAHRVASLEGAVMRFQAALDIQRSAMNQAGIKLPTLPLRSEDYIRE